MKYLIQNATILTMNPQDEIIAGGVAAIDGDKIVYVGNEAPEGFVANRVIDATGKVLMPGLVNAHTHLAMTLFRGYGSDLNLQDWLEKKIWPAEARLTDETCIAGVRLGMAEMLLSGTTCFLDMYDHMGVTAEQVGELGMRAVLTRAILCFDGYDLRMKEANDLYDHYHGTYEGRISVMMAPHAEYTNTEKSIRAILDMAKEKNCGINLHLSETVKEVEECKARHGGLSPVEWMESMGVFEFPTVAAHCVAVDEKDIEILRKHNVSVVHNATSNMKLGSGVAPVWKLLKAGVNVALGTDGAASNNKLDMIAELRQAALLDKLFPHENIVDTRSVLKMATINGAKALGLDRKIGSLEVGKEADLILLDIEKPWWAPRRDLCTQLVYAATNSDVCLTMVKGKILMENGIVEGLDLNSCIQAVDRASYELYEEL